MKRIILFCVIGFLSISLVGSILHFVYEWSGNNVFVGFFCAVNESVWEHLKIAIIPMFVWGIIGIWVVKNKNYGFGVFIALITVLIVMPVLFYGYTAFTKKSILAVDIMIFFISIGLGMLFAGLIFIAKPFKNSRILGCIGCVIIALFFAIFTYFPPKMELFRDPVNNQYGIIESSK